ncbi:MAG: GNAT family N-acetyltransferase [Clostridiales bacterium]|nr:GNAT family N-acetyltransferase [Clostridiales bacterium]
MNIRLFHQEDYEAAYRLWVNTPGMGLNTTDDSQDGVLRYLRRNPDTCFVAERDGEIVGTILAGNDGRRGFIYHLAVEKTHRKQGIGAALVERATSALKNEGIHKVALVVFTGNESGNAFWEKLGFIRREDLNYRNMNLSD